MKNRLQKTVLHLTSSRHISSYQFPILTEGLYVLVDMFSSAFYCSEFSKQCRKTKFILHDVKILLRDESKHNSSAANIFDVLIGQ